MTKINENTYVKGNQYFPCLKNPFLHFNVIASFCLELMVIEYLSRNSGSTFQLLLKAVTLLGIEVSNTIEKAFNISSFILDTLINILFGLTLTVTSPTLQTPSGVDVLTINKKKNKCVQSIKGSRLSLAKKAGDVRVGVYVQKGLNTQQRGLSFWDLYFSYIQYCNCITTYLSNCLLS